MQIQVRLSGKGICSFGDCEEAAEVERFLRFNDPVPVPPALEGIMEPMIGIKVYVCNDHAHEYEETL